jgi:hypothetical protein
MFASSAGLPNLHAVCMLMLTVRVWNIELFSNVEKKDMIAV